MLFFLAFNMLFNIVVVAVDSLKKGKLVCIKYKRLAVYHYQKRLNKMKYLEEIDKLQSEASINFDEFNIL